jgi:hypothetical protein
MWGFCENSISRRRTVAYQEAGRICGARVTIFMASGERAEIRVTSDEKK